MFQNKKQTYEVKVREAHRKNQHNNHASKCNINCKILAI